jgi:GR25 family glycosyltransferase involved in LPS biosynthesis
MKLAPIVLFVYNRPTHTRRTVEALLKNEEAKESDLIVYSDAPKKPEAADAVREVRDYIRTISGFKSVSIVERARNWGLANSVIDGVTTVLNKYGRIIVLEDDLVVTPHFLGFMNRALERYKHEPKVVQISGYMFPVKIKTREDALFLPLTTSWGWATWQRAWGLFDPEAKGYARLKAEPELRKRFNLDGAYDYFSMLEDQLAGRVDSWAIRWYLVTFLFEGLTLYPRQSLVTNAGFDGSGTHGITSGLLSRTGAREEFVPVSFPDTVNVAASWQVLCRRLRAKLSWVDRVRGWLRIWFVDGSGTQID